MFSKDFIENSSFEAGFEAGFAKGFTWFAGVMDFELSDSSGELNSKIVFLNALYGF